MAEEINLRGLKFNNRQEAMQAFARIGSTRAGNKIMVSKVLPLAVKVTGINYVGANILKQEALARGGDVVTSRDALLNRKGTTQVIIIGSRSMIQDLAKKIKQQPFRLKELSKKLEVYLKELDRKNNFKIGNRAFDLERDYMIMGILNVTPDSFYDGGRYYHLDQALKKAEQMAGEGADIIDIGGMSTRPGSDPVRVNLEIERTVPVIKKVREATGILVSIDTYRKVVAQEAAGAGADMVNDISALGFDGGMAEFVADNKLSAVLMHMKGTPRDMQKNPVYEDVIEEIYSFLGSAVSRATAAGIESDRIAVDPGIGFGKTAQHNLIILKKLAEFRDLGYPVLLGASRKSFMGKTLGLEVDQRLLPSVAVAMYGYLKGARIFRVHDVAETKKVLDMARTIEMER